VSYFIRIFSPSDKVPSIAKMRTALASENLAGVLTVDTGTQDDWAQLLLAHPDGLEIACIERNASSDDDLVAEEIEEFLELIEDCKPPNAAAWLAEYLTTVRTIYALQLLGGTDEGDGWDILHKVQHSILTQAGGVTHADGEGFYDQDGYQVLWQFADPIDGPWSMGVLKDGQWVHFRMDLGNKKHRAAFFRGEVPKGVDIEP